MKIHTVIIGTSKSFAVKGYYIKAKERFWGTMHQANFTDVQIDPYEYKEFSLSYGVGFDEIVRGKIIPKDSELKANLPMIENGLKKLVKRLKSDQHLTYIAFNGKTAAGWFFQYLDSKKIRKNPTKAIPDHKNFGKKAFDFYGKKIYVLPNTSYQAKSSWCPEEWQSFWKEVKKNTR
jgi:G:T/U-mismatch repair DNA glycosylase